MKEIGAEDQGVDMVSDLQSALREAVSAYVCGRVNLASVEELRSFAGNIGNLISEYSRGDRLEGSLLTELAAPIWGGTFSVG